MKTRHMNAKLVLRRPKYAPQRTPLTSAIVPNQRQLCITDYNQNLGREDRFDQLLRISSPCRRVALAPAILPFLYRSYTCQWNYLSRESIINIPTTVLSWSHGLTPKRVQLCRFEGKVFQVLYGHVFLCSISIPKPTDRTNCSNGHVGGA